LYLEFLAVLGLMGFIFYKIYINVPLNLILPTIAIFLAGAFRLIPSANRIIGSLQYIRYSKSVIDVIYNEILFTENVNVNISDKKYIENFKECINLESIWFNYEESEKEVLRGISLKIYKGEAIGLIGTSGSGKSTLIDIILGLLSPTKGKILMDGKEISYHDNSWRSIIGYVPQNIFLADDTIRNNIAFGIEIDKIDNKLIDASIISSNLEDLINELPDGLDTVIGEQGIRLSGGQRQRIGLARALYYNPQILVLDEATSALDSQTESVIMKTVFEMKHKKTILLIAHRLTTLLNCDRVIKLEKGKIVKIGSADEMIHSQ
jgi:ATP-binding cassette subfamily C protein